MIEVRSPWHWCLLCDDIAPLCSVSTGCRCWRSLWAEGREGRASCHWASNDTNFFCRYDMILLLEVVKCCANENFKVSECNRLIFLNSNYCRFTPILMLICWFIYFLPLSLFLKGNADWRTTRTFWPSCRFIVKKRQWINIFPIYF